MNPAHIPAGISPISAVTVTAAIKKEVKNFFLYPLKSAILPSISASTATMPRDMELAYPNIDRALDSCAVFLRMKSYRKIWMTTESSMENAELAQSYQIQDFSCLFMVCPLTLISLTRILCFFSLEIHCGQVHFIQ